jgi:hypothetical protein
MRCSFYHGEFVRRLTAQAARPGRFGFGPEPGATALNKARPKRPRGKTDDSLIRLSLWRLHKKTCGGRSLPRFGLEVARNAK